MIVLLVGLICIQIVARNRKPPLIKISDIKPLMNFSAVRIRGTLESDARRLSSGSTVYMVNDDTGTLAVFSNYASDTSLPRAGDRITVSGNLSVGAGNNIRLQMRSTDRVVVETAQLENAYASEVALADITADSPGGRMQVRGRVSRVWIPPAESKAPHRIVLTDRSGSLDVVHWLPEPPIIRAGDIVEVDGIVQVYKGQVQLKLLHSGDMSVLD